MRRGFGWRKRCFEAFAMGGRMTAARRAIIEVFANSRGHLTAEEVFWKVKTIYPAVGIATVYRTLEFMVQQGFLAKYSINNVFKYELLDEDNPHHHHLICVKCGKIEDFSDFLDEEKELVEKIEKKIEKKYKFKVQSHRLDFYGVCEECQGK